MRLTKTIALKWRSVPSQENLKRARRQKGLHWKVGPRYSLLKASVTMSRAHISNFESSIFLVFLDAGKLKGIIDSLQGVLSKRCDHEGITIIIIIIIIIIMMMM